MMYGAVRKFCLLLLLLFRNRTLFLFLKSFESFDFYLTEDLRDWSKDLLYLDPSVRKYLVSL